MLKNAPQLPNLALRFGCAPNAPGFFKHLTSSLQPLSLRRLDLYQLETRKKYLRKLLRLIRDTLRALSLNCISMEGEGNDFVTFLNNELSLKEVTLRCLNVGGRRQVS
jgi:hypothetical protein